MPSNDIAAADYQDATNLAIIDIKASEGLRDLEAAYAYHVSPMAVDITRTPELQQIVVEAFVKITAAYTAQLEAL